MYLENFNFEFIKLIFPSDYADRHRKKCFALLKYFSAKALAIKGIQLKACVFNLKESNEFPSALR
jgi:hypothetical protein